MLKYIVLGLIGLGVAGIVYVRLAPIDAAAWHVAAPPQPVGVYPAEGGHMVVRASDDPAADLAQLDGIIRADARTSVLAGSVEEGMITYVTRSALWGFPDFTTVQTGEGTLTLSSRLRFGRSDMGVNKARMEGWLAELDA